MTEPPTWHLNPEQHQQVIQAIAQNPTIASCFKATVSQSGGMEDLVHIAIPGHEYSLQVSKEDWPASGQTSHTTTAKGTPSTSQTHTPVHHTSSLLAAIPSLHWGCPIHWSSTRLPCPSGGDSQMPSSSQRTDHS